MPLPLERLSHYSHTLSSQHSESAESGIAFSRDACWMLRDAASLAHRSAWAAGCVPSSNSGDAFAMPVAYGGFI